MMQKEKQLVPKLRFLGFEGEWEKKTLFDISKEVAYGMNSAATKFDGENKYLRITDIDESSRKFVPNPLSSPDDKIETKYILKKNDIVFARTGASVGKSYLYDEKDGKLLFAGFLIKFNIINSNPYFIYQQTFKESYNKWVQVYSMRSGQPGLNAEEYKALKINIPSLKEQQKIANFLTAIDHQIHTLEQKKTLLEHYKKGVLQKIFKQELRFKPDLSGAEGDDNGNVFAEWEEKTLGEYLVQYNEKSDYSDQYPVLTSSRKGIMFQTDYYSGNQVASKDNTGYNIVPRNYFTYRHMSDDLVFKFNRNTICDMGIVSTLYPVFTTKNIDDKFLEYKLNEGFEIQRYALLQKQGGSRTYLYFKKLSNMKINSPSLKEQTKIANFLSAIDKNIALVNTKIEHTKAYKKGLLQQMFV